MAVEGNGWPVGSFKSNGKPNGSLQRREVPGINPTVPASLAAGTFNMATRLVIWYIIITTLFRCPSSFEDLTEQSPQICQPYLSIRSHVTPYVEPYLNTYVSPHVERVRPYAQNIHQQIYTPVVTYCKHYYDTYGAPKVDQARTFSQEKWEKVLKPQVDAAQVEAKKQYYSNVAPHVDKALVAVAPYVNASRENALQVYNKHILPTYESSRPYLQDAYSYTRKAVVETGLPYAHAAWSATVVLFDRTIWPRIRILYGENVEPQLVRIGQRLGRYRDGRKMKAVVDNMEPSSLSPSAYFTISSAASSIISETTLSASTSSHNLRTPAQDAEHARAKIEDDLNNWQDKFAKAADKGMEDLQERIREIADRQIESQVGGTGRALVVQLEETVNTEEGNLKKEIKALVRSLPEDVTENVLAAAEERLSKATRAAGLSVKEKAQALRSWKEFFDHETSSLISAASNSTLEVIDNIRDLGLQEIGMKWAHMEGVTYKDWSKYHEVRKSFDEWHQKVDKVAQNHPGLQKSKDASEELEAEGMAIAEQAAKELGRLKEVGRWKTQAKDKSDDFSTRYMPAAAAARAQKVMEKVSEASEQAIGTSQGTAESIISHASQNAADAASYASAQVIGTEAGIAEEVSSKIAEALGKATDVTGHPQAKFESLSSAAVEKANPLASGAKVRGTENVARSADVIGSSASSMAGQASEKVYGGAMAQEVKGQEPILDDIIDDDTTYSESMHGMVEQAADKYVDITKAVKEAIMGAPKTQDTVESASSVADEQYSRALAAASSVLHGTKQGTVESINSGASDRWAEAVAAASSIIYGTPAPMTQSAANVASSAYADATSQAQAHYSRAMSVVSAQISGPPKPVHREMFASVESAYSDSLDAAKGRLHSAMSAASTAMYGSPHQQMISAANARYSNAMAAASSQLEYAKTAAGATSKPGYEKVMSDASSRYSSLIDAASGQHASATRAASEAIYGPSQSPLGSISALASSRLADSLNAARAQYEGVKSIAGATPTPVHQQYLQEGQRKYYEAVGLAHERYSEFINNAKAAVYGTPTPVHQSLASAASEQIYGTPTPAYQGMLDHAQAQYSQMTSQASEKFQAVLGSANSAVGKTEKSPAQSIIDSASSQYSSALSVASASLSSVSAAASSGIYGTSTGKIQSVASVASERAASISVAVSTAAIGSETPWSASMASQASQNWEALVSKASEQVYGAPTPFHESVYSQAGAYAAQASNTAAAQFEAVQALFSELVSGREPDFTESVMNRLSAAYYTGAHASMAASASSYANVVYSSASSAVSSVFTPPATLETIIAAANEQINAAVDAASKQVYGTEKGTFEKGSSAARSVAASASSRISDVVYGTQPGYIDYAQKSMDDIAASASEAIAAAIYGTTATGATASVTSAASEAYNTISSALVDKVERGREAVEVTRQKIREAVYGPEKGAMESAQAKILEAVESAKERMATMVGTAGAAADRIQNAVGEGVGSIASAAAKTGGKVKDEL
ncbi:MAG: hypothetical protein Q9163_000483 [Psora crenata]